MRKCLPGLMLCMSIGLIFLFSLTQSGRAEKVESDGLSYSQTAMVIDGELSYKNSTDNVQLSPEEVRYKDLIERIEVLQRSIESISQEQKRGERRLFNTIVITVASALLYTIFFHIRSRR
jgi:hypothetical protein